MSERPSVPSTQREWAEYADVLEVRLAAREEELREWQADANAIADERDSLRAAIEDYILWEPGKRGHAEAHRRLCSVLHPDTEGGSE